MTDITKIIGDTKRMEKEQEEARLAHSKLTGQRESEVERMKKDFNVETVEDAEKELKKLQARLTTIDTKIVEKYNYIKENYDKAPA